MGVRDERGGRLVEAVRKVVPECDPGQVKQWGWQTIGTDLRDVSKHDHIDQRCQDGLHEKPDRPKDRLFVDRNKISSHEENNKITVSPEFAEMYIKPTRYRFDN